MLQAAQRPASCLSQCSTSYSVPAAPRVCGRDRGAHRRCVVLSRHSRAASSSGNDATTNTIGDEFQRFAKKHDLEGLAQKAKAKASRSWEDAQASAKRTYIRLNSEYGLEEKAQKAAQSAQEAWRDIDQEFSVRRRARSLVDSVRRQLPAWQASLNEFATHWYGKVALVAGLVLVVSSPLFWKVVNLFLLLWWLSIPISLLLVGQAQQRMAAQAQDAAQARARAQAQAGNPFADMFRAQAAAQAGGRGAGAQARTGAGGFGFGRGSSSSSSESGGGPVIDAEWTTIDEGDATSGSSRSGRQRRR